MKTTDPFSVDQIWDFLLSRQPDLIEKSFLQLNRTDRKSMILHLQRMSTESSWHSEQKKSAEIALATLKTINVKHKE